MAIEFQKAISNPLFFDLQLLIFFGPVDDIYCFVLFAEYHQTRLTSSERARIEAVESSKFRAFDDARDGEYISAFPIKRSGDKWMKLLEGRTTSEFFSLEGLESVTKGS